MTSPTTSSPTSDVLPTFSPYANALIAGQKWGGPAGTGVVLSYSFPWTTSPTAAFYGPGGTGQYSTLQEMSASAHGLNAVQQESARAALQSWADVANITFAEVSETSTNVGDVRFGWTSASQSTVSGDQAWGWASYPNSYYPTGGDVWISSLSSGASDGDWAKGSYNYQSLIHEIGHAIGLKHSFEGFPTLPAAEDSRQYSIMSYNDAPHSLFISLIHNANGSVAWESHNVVPETPMLYDIAAAQALYGANTTHETGDNIYQFDPHTPFLKTIWDAGGNDTISVQNFSLGCVIDLQQGHFSRISIPSDSTAGYAWRTDPPDATYDGTDNLAIAFGTVIENAVGGDANDVLIGNSSDNHLEGRFGSDTMYGGAGNDTFDALGVAMGGDDAMYGGTGNDTFYVNSLADKVIEYANEGNDTIWATSTFSIANLPNIENLRGFGGGMQLTGNAGANVISGGFNSDALDGGAGTDTALFNGKFANFTVSKSGEYFVVNDTTNAEGRDSLINIERIQFADATVALDIDGVGGRAYRIYKAAFDRTPDSAGVGYWISKMDMGVTLSEVSGGFVASNEYKALYPTDLSNADLVGRYYQNILGRPAEKGGLDFWTGVLDTHKASVPDVLAAISESAENQAGLIGVIGNGFVFTPYLG